MSFNVLNKKITRTITFLVLFFLILGSVYTVNTVLAVDPSYGLDEITSNIDAFETGSISDEGGMSGTYLSTRIGSIIGSILSFVGALFLVLMIFAGISWMLAGGNEEKIKKAGKLLVGSIIGLLIVLAAYTLTAFLGDMLLPPQ